MSLLTKVVEGDVGANGRLDAVNVTVKLPVTMAQTLVDLAMARKVSRSVVVREAVTEYLDARAGSR